MSRIHPECHDSDPRDRSAAADVVLRQESDEEDEGDGEEDNDDDDNDDDQGDEDDEGYSEVSLPRSSEQLAVCSESSAAQIR